ncbi:MAG: flavin reductase family protein [Parvibaculaceae bacterium]
MHAEGLSETDLYRNLAADRNAFLEAMSRTASGVYLVTTDGHGGRVAATISAVASISADPTMLLACINKRNPLCAALETNRQFCINAFNATQVRISQTFAGRPGVGGQAYDFGTAEWLQGQTQAQRLKGAVASFDCLLHHSLTLGTHCVFIGLVVAVACDEGRPLLFSRRGYHSSRKLHPD